MSRLAFSSRPADADPPGLAVVTGATAGIGRAFAERLAAAGHDLLLVARDADRLAAVAAHLAATYGVQAAIHPADLADEPAVRALAARIAAGPALALLVNNAGFGPHAPVVGGDPDLDARMLAVHCAAPLRLMQAALPHMVARRTGAVINVASIAAFVPNARYATYNATKAFLQQISEGVAAEVAPAGVRVQALCPGFTRTEFHARIGAASAQSALHVPDALWLSAEAVIDASLRALARGGPVTVIPGLPYRAAVAFLRHVPLRLLGRVARGRRDGRAADRA